MERFLLEDGGELEIRIKLDPVYGSITIMYEWLLIFICYWSIDNWIKIVYLKRFDASIYAVILFLEWQRQNLYILFSPSRRIDDCFRTWQGMVVDTTCDCLMNMAKSVRHLLPKAFVYFYKKTKSISLSKWSYYIWSIDHIFSFNA